MLIGSLRMQSVIVLLTKSSYLERLVQARKLLMEQRSDMRRELERCESSIAQLDEAIDLLASILNDEAQLSEPDRGA